jgi:hypothetical protein
MGEAAWTLFCTVLGAIIGFGASCFIQWRQNLAQRKIARMQVATNLRHWMTRVLWAIYETRNWDSTEGQGGTRFGEIPKFRFEKALTQVSLLEPETAKTIFGLIHRKDDANTAIKGTAEYEGDEDAHDLCRGRAGGLWLEALAIYDGMAQQLGWTEKVFSDSDKTMMRSEVESLEAHEKERASSDPMFLDVLKPG